MKLFTKVTSFAVAGCAALLCAGCNAKTYSVYTNMPEGSFEISDSNYVLGGTIAGYASDEKETLPAAENFTSRRRLYYSMTTDAELVVSADFSAEGADENYTAFVSAVGSALTEIDKALSTTVVNSDVSKFNQAAAGATVEISEIGYNVLTTAKTVYEYTDGYYNPALYYNVLAYGFGSAHDYPENESELPDEQIIAGYTELAQHFGDVQLSKGEGENEGKYFVEKPLYTVEAEGETLAMKLDLGGIGKGYAVDCVDRLFDEYGYEYGYFNFGSSSMLVKGFSAGGAYNVGLAGPRSPMREPYIYTKIQGEKLSTSGDNEQFYKIGGVRYCHIIDPTTGKPVQTGIMSVTVIGGSAAEDDALTTAIMAMGKERAVEFIEKKLTDRKAAFCCE
ncbi:MAG: FAD:protein FMN transferase [Clostridia bacterium]|nr:FAD:protein FMN transferase [Clostridia bacterium]